MKTAISIPNDVFKTADNFARRKKLSRSAVFTIAVTEFLSHHNQEDVTEQLNKVYGKQESSLDPVLHGLQFASISKEKW
ncbi:MAG: ChpI protein [Kiritimatiellae bacterium]|nr:ChpI protein [Kiritimatiellia bacterium]MDD5519958.1 ChpI protein [Kiritimatiellia bacterium]